MKLLNLLSKEDIKKIEIKSFSKNELIFHENDICKQIGIVLSGEIKISSYSFSGTELIYNRVEKDNAFGTNLIFANDNRYKGDIVAINNTTIAFIKDNVLLEFLKRDDFLIEYMNQQSIFARKLNFQIKLLSYESISERFYFYLYQNENKIKYSSITNLASILHFSRESLSRFLAKEEKKRHIKRSNKTIEKI